MANTTIPNLILCTILTAMLAATAVHGRQLPTPLDDNHFLPDHRDGEWLQNLIYPTEKEKFTKLHFYVHDISTGPNQSVYDVAESSITWNKGSRFGRVQVADHLLTVGPDPESEKVGRLQGIHVMADLHVAALGVNWNFLFNDGSTITVVGRLVAMAKEGELSIVGGTGEYMLARGIACKRTLRMDPHTFNSVMEYTLYVYSSSGLELPGM